MIPIQIRSSGALWSLYTERPGEWGFYKHRLCNRLAIWTIPSIKYRPQRSTVENETHFEDFVKALAAGNDTYTAKVSQPQAKDSDVTIWHSEPLRAEQTQGNPYWSQNKSKPGLSTWDQSPGTTNHRVALKLSFKSQWMELKGLPSPIILGT